MICLSYYLLGFLFNKIGEEGGTGSTWKLGWGGLREEVAQIMYTSVVKCKNYKRREK
jgi:hypothetical protein